MYFIFILSGFPPPPIPGLRPPGLPDPTAGFPGLPPPMPPMPPFPLNPLAAKGLVRWSLIPSLSSYAVCNLGMQLCKGVCDLCHPFHCRWKVVVLQKLSQLLATCNPFFLFSSLVCLLPFLTSPWETPPKQALLHISTLPSYKKCHREETW